MSELLKKRIFMFDLARGMYFNRKEIIDLLDMLEATGYNCLMLYLEGAFAFEGIPGVIHPDIMTPDDAQWINGQAKQRNIEILPATNIFYHMEHFLDQERFFNLRDCSVKSVCKQLDFNKPGAEDFVLKFVMEYVKHFNTKVVHIGGDEAFFKEERFQDYVKIFSSVCQKLLDAGITPCIWGDVAYKYKEIVKDIPKGTVIFDWQYGGHRPESLRFFKENGFSVIACPSDSSWSSVNNCQVSYSGSGIKPDEVEAFLADGYEQESYGGCLTYWNASLGNPFWSQIIPIARSGLYMSGKWKIGTDEESVVENTLFGRITPCTRLTRIFQNEVNMPLWQELSSKLIMDLYVPRFAAYLGSYMFKFGVNIPLLMEKVVPAWKKAVSSTETELAGWTPQGERELRCYNAFKTMIKTVLWMCAFSEAVDAALKEYHFAAIVQFDNIDLSVNAVDNAGKAFTPVFKAFDELEEALKIVEETTGHPRTDKVWLKKRYSDIEKIQLELKNMASRLKVDDFHKKVPLPAWRGIMAGLLQDATQADMLLGN